MDLDFEIQNIENEIAPSPKIESNEKPLKLNRRVSLIPKGEKYGGSTDTLSLIGGEKGLKSWIYHQIDCKKNLFFFKKKN